MKVKIDDTEAVGTLRPLDLAAYLRSRGWSEVDPDGPLSIWEMAFNGGTVEVLAPKHQQWRDYGRRVRAVLDTLGEVEDRSQLSIWRDIVAVSADVVRLRAVSGKASDDTIAFLDGLGVAAAGRGLLLAAACSAARPQKSYAARKPALALKYLDEIRLGQSERGSYVVTVISPVSPALTPAPDQTHFQYVEEPFVVPFARRVTLTLGRALEQLYRAAERGAATGRLDAFEDGVELGVSADMCEALGHIRTSARIYAFETMIGWAPSRPAPAGAPARTVFTQDVLEVIDEAGRMLRERATLDDFELEGLVIRLAELPGEIYHKAVIAGRVNGQARQVSMELKDEDWRIAKMAFDQRLLFRCTGELKHSGKLYEPANPRGVVSVTDW